VVALLVSLQIQRGFRADPYTIRKLLVETAIPCDPRGGDDCRRLLRGKLNIPGVLERIRDRPELLASSAHFKPSKKYTAMASNLLNENLVHSVTNNAATVEPSCNCTQGTQEKHLQKKKEEDEEPDESVSGMMLAPSSETVLQTSDKVKFNAKPVVPNIFPSHSVKQPVLLTKTI
jgi:hypothetical protein